MAIAVRSSEPEGSVLGVIGDNSASNRTLESLMTEYAEGRDAAFTPIYQLLAPKLYGRLVRQCKDRELAKDVLQNTFAKIHRARSAYSKGAAVVPWVLVIAQRTLYDELRSARAREILSADGTLPEPPHEEGLAPEDARQLELALMELPESYREAIELTKLHGYSGGEAAEVLSTTQSAVKLRVHRGYALLRERLRSEAA